MPNDTVFDRDMNVVACRPAHVIEQRLKAGNIPSRWAYVLVGETQKVITVTEYANREKFSVISEVVMEILERQAKRPISGHARKLYAERMAKKILDLI